MPYCSKCGAEISEDAKFCPKCGTPVSPPPGVEVPPAPTPAKTGIDLIGADKLLQEHWIKRVLAIIIDGIILAVALAILIIIIFIPFLILTGTTPFPLWFGSLGGWLLGFPFALGALSILYFSFAESIYGQTIGKRLMGFKVATVDGRIPNLGKTIVRNVSKIHWVLLLLDVIVGLVTPGDPHQKYSDRIVGTTVTAVL